MLTTPGQVAAAFLLGAGLSLAAGAALLPWLRRWRWGQEVRADGPARHLAKAGTPTMGGLAIVAAVPVAAFLLGADANLYLAAALACLVGFGAVGLADDMLKVVFRRPLGLKARHKLAAQALLAGWAGWLAADLHGPGTSWPAGEAALHLGWWYLPFAVLVMVGAANAANLTDGLDGLLAGTALPAALAYSFIGALQGRPELASFAAALAGACLGFLRYNRHPALVFMGDTGALAVGGALGVLAVLTATELLLPVVAGVWVAEALSVMVQVAFFRLTGRRVLRMSPLHHHFELLGWSEGRVVRRFWAASWLLAAAGVLAYAWRGGGA